MPQLQSSRAGRLLAVVWFLACLETKRYPRHLRERVDEFIRADDLMPGLRWLRDFASPTSLRQYLSIKRSGLFDPAWYGRQYPAFATEAADPIIHYLRFGSVREWRPNPWFDGRWYLQVYPDVASAGIDPFFHYVRTGRREKRRANKYWHLRYDYRVPGARSNRHLSAPPAWMSPDRKRVAIIDVAYPNPSRDSGSVDAFNFVRIFQELGFEVVFVALLEPDRQSKARDVLESIGVKCIYRPEYVDAADFIDRCGRFFDLFFLCRVSMGGELFEAIRRASPNAKVCFNTVDLHHLREERQARHRGDRALLHVAALTKEREMYLSRLSDAVLVVSAHEQRVLENIATGARVYHVPLIREAIDRRTSFQGRKGVCFLGSFKHVPNLDAVEYFFSAIWPHVLDARPEEQISILGSEMPTHFGAMQRQGVNAVGYVEDLGAALERYRVMVAPLRFGAGAKGKIASALAHGVPTVLTSIAAEGMGLRDGEDTLIADDPAMFARHVVRLLEDDALWSRLSANGLELAKREFSVARGKLRIERILGEIGVSAPHH